jgi:thiamine pyrophosphate-dependent acetolactate synthase large subunit-like protein
MLADTERPLIRASNRRFGSDAIADVLRQLDITYMAMNPGASFRGLHDSLVNHLGNDRPQMLVCLHEEHAIGVAHGYAKVTGQAMAAAIHANIGVMHASMGIFNAWCDRVPMLILGATGPMDAARRRPGIDWQHTVRDQGAIIRDYVKWDDQPGSVEAAREALVRGLWLTNAAPHGPVYINLDTEIQEQEVKSALPPLDIARFMPKVHAAPTLDAVRAAINLLRSARAPGILAGRISRSESAWRARIALAETLSAKVFVAYNSGAGFPSRHPLFRGLPAQSREARNELAQCDALLSLEWLDLAGTLRAASPDARVIAISQDYQLHNGWSFDHQAHAPADVFMPCHSDDAVDALLKGLGVSAVLSTWTPVAARSAAPPEDDRAPTTRLVASMLRDVLSHRDVTLTNEPGIWSIDAWPMTHPLDHIGRNGGGGLGSSPSIAIGAALALREMGSDRMAVCVTGDGDFLFGATALWTAVHYRLPVLYVILNNCSYFNDEVHQEQVALMRGRPVENRWIGMRLDGPIIDLATLANAQGATGFGPVTRSGDLTRALADAVAVVAGGGVALVDVRIPAGDEPRTVATRSPAST